MENQMNSLRSVVMKSQPPLLLRYQNASSSRSKPMYSMGVAPWGWGCWGIGRWGKLNQHNTWRWLTVPSDGLEASLNPVLRRAVGLKLFLDLELAFGVLPDQNALAATSNFNVAGICKAMSGGGHVGCSSVARRGICGTPRPVEFSRRQSDRKSTRLNSSPL